jgi:hypothetical protein
MFAALLSFATTQDLDQLATVEELQERNYPHVHSERETKTPILKRHSLPTNEDPTYLPQSQKDPLLAKCFSLKLLKGTRTTPEDV